MAYLWFCLVCATPYLRVYISDTNKTGHMSLKWQHISIYPYNNMLMSKK